MCFTAPARASLCFRSISTIPGATSFRPSLHTISGCFTQDAPVSEFMVGEFHAQLTLDNGETVRLIFPESLAMHTTTTNASLLSDTQFLMAGHSYISDLKAPRLQFATGGAYTMNVVETHKILPLLPISVQPPTNHRIIIMHIIIYPIRSFILLQSSYNKTTRCLHPNSTGMTSSSCLCLQRNHATHTKEFNRYASTQRLMG